MLNLLYIYLAYIILLFIVFFLFNFKFLLFLNSIFSIIIFTIFLKNTTYINFLIFFLILLSWAIILALKKNYSLEIKKNELEKLEEKQLDLKKIIFELDNKKDREALYLSKKRLEKYNILNITLNYFDKSLTEENLYNLLLEEVKKIVSCNIKIIKNLDENIITTWIKKNKLPIFVEDITKDYRFSSEIIKNYNFKSIILIPIMFKENVYSILECWAEEKNFFDKMDMRIISIIVDFVSLSITTNKLFEQKKELVKIDNLTKVYNRKTFLELAEQEIKNSIRFDTPISFLMIDIDYFKKCNDTYGHLYGDEILKEVAKILKENLREIDFIGRYGGEEFIILITKPIEIAFKKAEELRTKVKNAKKVTISIGISSNYNPKTSDIIKNISILTLINNADNALYDAKKSGRNKTICYTHL
jgi:diguanylate cyclase (GGDEF)-like protein